MEVFDLKYFKKLIGERIYLSPRNIEDVEYVGSQGNGRYNICYTVTDESGNKSKTIQRLVYVGIDK